MSSLFRLLPWVVFLGGLYSNRDRFAQGVKDATDMAKGAATHQEMGNIASFLNNDIPVDGVPDPDNFTSFLRANGESKGRGDPSRDFWGTPYRLDVHPPTYAVRSAGPDTQFDDDDDLVLEGSLPN